MTFPNIPIKTITILSICLGAFLASSQFIGSVHNFLNHGAVISIVELYLILFGIGILFYQNLKLNFLKNKFKKDLNDMHKEITNEYTNFVMQKIEYIEMLISQSNKDIQEIKEELKIISKNILDIARG